ncbi:HdeA/HdeB family chaperone [Megalodesulfovibrio paquesii]
MNKVMTGALLALLLLAFAMPAQAKKRTGVDMGKYTCADLMKEKTQDIALVLMWVDGYLSSETGDLKMDEAWIEELAETIGTECQRDPDKRLMEIVQDIVEASE